MGLIESRAMQQLSKYGKEGFKVLQDKVQRVNEQNDEIIDCLNQVMRGQIALWQSLKMLHAGDKGVFKKIEDDLGIKMEVEK